MTAEPEEVLPGGVANAGRVVRVGDHVLRPATADTPRIHALLRYVRAAGFEGVPEPVGVDPDGRERLVYIPGDVPFPPFPAWSQTDEVLASTAELMRGFHDASAGFDATIGGTWTTELSDPQGGPVICHNDVCPENVVYRNGRAVALLDFEFAAPGRRVHDIAAFARMCVPIDTDADAARLGRGGLDPFSRLAVIADAYGFESDDRGALLEALSAQITGGEAFVTMWNEMGGAERYRRRQAWFEANRHRFAAALGMSGLFPSQNRAE